MHSHNDGTTFMYYSIHVRFLSFHQFIHQLPKLCQKVLNSTEKTLIFHDHRQLAVLKRVIIVYYNLFPVQSSSSPVSVDSNPVPVGEAVWEITRESPDYEKGEFVSDITLIQCKSICIYYFFCFAQHLNQEQK